MAQQDAYGLVVAVPVDASGGETVPEGVEADVRKIQTLHQPLEISAVYPRLHRCGFSRKDKTVVPGAVLEGLEQSAKIQRHRDFTYGFLGFGSIYHQLRPVLAVIPVHIYALKGFVHRQQAILKIEIFPLQSADFSNAQAAEKAYLQTDALPVRMVFHIIDQPLLLVYAQYGQLRLLSRGGEVYIHLLVWHEALLGCEP